MKNIRKKYVLFADEIEKTLDRESKELGNNFREVRKNIDNDWIIKLYWNTLVDYKKHDKENFVDHEISIALALNMSGVIGSTGKAMNSWAVIAVSLVGTGVVGKAFIDTLYHLPLAEKYQAMLQAMKVNTPDLYDVELLFNGVDKNEIDTSEYDGKAVYQAIADKQITKENLEVEEEKTF